MHPSLPYSTPLWCVRHAAANRQGMRGGLMVKPNVLCSRWEEGRDVCRQGRHRIESVKARLYKLVCRWNCMGLLLSAWSCWVSVSAPVASAGSVMPVAVGFVRYMSRLEWFNTSIINNRQLVVRVVCWCCQLLGERRKMCVVRGRLMLGWLCMAMYFLFFHLGKMTIAKNSFWAQG